MDISARAISLPDRPRLGHSGHQCSHAPGRPVLHLLVPLADLGGQADEAISSRAPHLVEFLCSCPRTVLSSGPHIVESVARKARSRPAVALASHLALPLPGRAL